LNFHGLGAAGPELGPEVPYWLDENRFRSILGLVGRATGTPLITFDDGNASDVEIALPALKDFRLTATFFILSDRIGQAGYLSASDIRALHGAGMGIGSHGAAHVRWTELASEALEGQISRSLSVLTDIVGTPVRGVAVPFGAYDRRVLAILGRCAVDRVFTSDGGPASPRSWVVARNTIRSDTPLSLVERWLRRGFSPVERGVGVLRGWRRRLLRASGVA
jgi:peptidoglycan/xylan/chitin deacetylase (PgdA/CDA1 family)